MKQICVVLGLLFFAVTVKGDGITVMWGPRAAFQVTFRIVDDAGDPVQGAEFGCNWGRGGFAAPDFGQIHVTTGADGTVVVAGRSVFNEFNYHAEKSGYYPVRSVGYDRAIFQRRVNGRWERWNPTVRLILKRIRNAIPMYAKHVQLKIAEFDKPMAYDLVAGDWVAPRGVGRVADFIFVARREVRDDRDYEGTLELTFSNPGDGIFALEKNEDGSRLRLPYTSPESGYVPRGVWTEIRHLGVNGQPMIHRASSPTMNYFFRVRTVTDAQGNVISAYYGKIHGDIRFFIGTRVPWSGLAFTYYLNPDGTRNVEFDPKRNLFKPANSRDSAFWNLAP